MKRSILHELDSLPFFSITSLKVLEEIHPKALYQNLQRWVRTRDIFPLKNRGLITEAIYPVTSIALKAARRYRNSLGAFEYRHLHPRLYFGFEQHRFGKNSIYEATAPKALFDFLYLRLPALDPQDPSTLDALRINWSELDQPSFNALRQTIRKSSVKKLANMIPLLFLHCL